MKEIFVSLVLFLSGAMISWGQASVDSISMIKTSGGYEVYKGGSRLNLNQLVYAMRSNEQAYEKIRSAQSDKAVASILGYVGGFLIGWPIGTAIGGGDPNWAMAGIGAGLAIVSIPIGSGCNKKVRQAVQIYNDALQSSSYLDKNELEFVVTARGMGLALTFR